MKKIIIKLLNTILYKLNKTASFNEMYNKLLKYAESNGEKYVRLSIDKNTFDSIVVKAYIHNFDLVDGKTIEECIEKLNEYKNKYKKEGVIKEVLI